MKIVCDACSAKYSIADDKVRGKVFKIRCKKCSNIIVVRGVAEGEQAAGFDQNETHVFDYPHQESGHGPTVEGGADDEVWYLVIDGAQAGPMTPALVRDRFARGEIDADTYAWREGFPDWERLGSTAEFQDLDAAGGDATMAGSAPGADDAAAGMFGGPALDAPAAAQSDPNDLFAAQSGVGAPASAAGGAPAAAAEGGGAADDLFGAPAGSAPAAEAGQAERPVNVESTLTGQRNENSVLFSLNNLASLAGGDGSSRAAPAQAPSPSQSSTSSGSEGSGLIDIRSMASVYLGENESSGSAGKEKGDDLPVFGSGGFESASPVLLPPTQTAQTNNKLLYTLIGVIGALVVAATVLVLIVVKNMGGEPDQQELAAGAGDDGPAEAADTGEGAGGAGEDDGPLGEDEGDEGSDAPEAAGAEEDEESDAEEGAEADESSEPEEESAAEQEASEKEPRSAQQRRQRERRQRERRQRERRQQREQKREQEQSSSGGSSSGGGEDCDEVSCLVNPKRPCCAKYRDDGSSGGGGGGGGGSSRSDLPKRLSQSDVRSGMSKVRGRVSRCGKQHNISGTVQVRVKVAPSGRVGGVSASGVSGGGKSCVERAVRRARFKKTQRGMSFKYPFGF